MIDISKAWLGAVPWESVQTINQALCQARKLEYQANADALPKISARWNAAVLRVAGLVETLQLIRECCDARPFMFNNGNTFAAVARTLVDDWLKALPPIEAQIMRTTVCHFVAGEVGKKELLQVLNHLGPACKKAMPAATPAKDAVPLPVSRVQPQGAA